MPMSCSSSRHLRSCMMIMSCRMDSFSSSNAASAQSNWTASWSCARETSIGSRRSRTQLGSTQSLSGASWLGARECYRAARAGVTPVKRLILDLLGSFHSGPSQSRRHPLLKRLGLALDLPKTQLIRFVSRVGAGTTIICSTHHRRDSHRGLKFREAPRLLSSTINCRSAPRRACAETRHQGRPLTYLFGLPHPSHSLPRHRGSAPLCPLPKTRRCRGARGG
jgi:hypothetical protein